MSYWILSLFSRQICNNECRLIEKYMNALTCLPNSNIGILYMYIEQLILSVSVKSSE